MDSGPTPLGGGDVDFVHVRLDELQTSAALVDRAGGGTAGPGFRGVEALSVVRYPDVDAAAVGGGGADESYEDAVVGATGVLAGVDAGLDDGVSHLVDVIGAHAHLASEVPGRAGGGDLDVRDHRKSQLHLPCGGRGQAEAPRETKRRGREQRRI